MKGFTISEILLLSLPERAAIRIPIDPKRTIIIGSNDTGKSSLVKSIYQTFGAEPSITDSKWEKAAAIAAVKFSLDGEEYMVLRNEKIFSFFDQNGKLIKRFKGVMKGLNEYVANLFSFGLKLPNRKSQIITPPPAFYFLPFYIDQDKSWQSPWASFKGTGVIQGNWKDAISKYHTGIRPNEYYKTKGEIDKLKEELKGVENEIKIAKNILDNLKENYKKAHSILI